MDLQNAQCSAWHIGRVSEALPLFSSLPRLVLTLGYRKDPLLPPGNSGGKPGGTPSPRADSERRFLVNCGNLGRLPGGGTPLRCFQGSIVHILCSWQPVVEIRWVSSVGQGQGHKLAAFRGKCS